MKHSRHVQDQYQRPDNDDEDLNRIEACFERLARKMRDDSGAGQTKFIRPAGHPIAPFFAQSQLGLFPIMAPWPA